MQAIERRFGSLFFKCAVIGALASLMLLPLARVESVVAERQELRQRAYEVIAAGFGGEQVVGAPLLTVAREERSITVDPTSQVSREVWRAGAPPHLLAPGADTRVLPASSTRTAHEFSARWQVLGLNGAVPQRWRGDAVGAPALLAPGLRMHGMHYLLVGLALATFYLLLLGSLLLFAVLATVMLATRRLDWSGVGRIP